MRMLAVILLGFLGGCFFGETENTGASCVITPPPASASLSVLQVPTLECDSRLCLRTAGAAEALCSHECDRDDDCAGGPGSRCVSGFACETPFSTGPFAYRKLCVCRDPSR